MDNIARLNQEVAALRRRMDQQNVLRAVHLPPLMMMTIIGGNTLTSGQAGIKRIATPTTCPADYDPNVTTSYADGWGNAYLYVAGQPVGNKVLVLNDGALGTLVESWEVYTAGPNSLMFGTTPKIFYRGFSR